MATPAQIAANRANAQKSTGPRTDDGKAASRYNALKHGLDAASVLLPGESAEDFQAIVDEYTEIVGPATLLEEVHLATLIHTDWLRRRHRRTLAKLTHTLAAEIADPADLDIAMLGDSPTARLIRKTNTQLASAERSYYRALNDLRRLDQQKRREEKEDWDNFLPAPRPAISAAQLASFRQNAHPAPPPPPASIEPAPRSALAQKHAPFGPNDNPAWRL